MHLGSVISILSGLQAIAVYVRYQINCGAQVVQLFDSYAGQLSPQDYDTFALLYQQKVVKLVKETHPDTPLIQTYFLTLWIHYVL